ncbi:MAG TPA: hypothetical protein VKB93_24875 [Thermoanaerobaculia bacterium]|nr:hypothetical protein [Thermoanaerobaculia bacterium]
MRGEEVAGSIDAHVRESIERMVDEIRSSIEDVRIAVDSQLKAALQSVQADVNSINFLPHIQRSLGELQEAIEADRPPAPAAPAGAGANELKEAVAAIERNKSQVDVLNALLEQCLRFGSRAALLILRNETTFGGWKGAGFSAHGGNDDNVKRFNATPGLIPELDQLLKGEYVIQYDGNNLATRLGMAGSDRAVLVPMVIKDKVAAAVYVDAVGDDVSKLDVAAIQLLVFTTGLLVDTLAIRKKSPSPSLNDSAAAAPVAAAAAPEPQPKPAPPPPPPPPPSPTPTPTPAIPTRTDAGTVAINAAELRAMMAAQRPNFNVPAAEEFSAPAATAKVPALEPKAPPPPPPPPPPAAPASADERPSTQYVPPSNLTRANAGGPQTEDAKRHDEARRFARLLVSEIKLYNEAKVEQGRRNHDLYERLKEDIDRSRQMYDERIGDDVRKVSNYFYDELVRILADGKAESLGL